MRVFTTVYLAVTLTFTAHAATISKRAISEPVSKCIGLMNIINTDIGGLTNSFTNYHEDESTTPADSVFPSVIRTETQKQHVELRDNALKTLEDFHKVRLQCCAVNSAAEEDGKAIFAAFESYATASANAMNILNSKISAFDKKNKPYYLVKDMLSQLPEAANPLHECLVQRVSSADARKAYDSKDKIDKAVIEAIKTFSVYGKAEGEVSSEGVPGMMSFESLQPEAPARLPDEFLAFAQAGAPEGSLGISSELQSESPASVSDAFFSLTQYEAPAFSFDTQLN